MTKYLGENGGLDVKMNWVAICQIISISLDLCSLNYLIIQFFVTSWTVAHQAPPSVEFSRQEYWSGLPFPFPGDLPDPGKSSLNDRLFTSFDHFYHCFE